jgi:hypothetical protein
LVTFISDSRINVKVTSGVGKHNFQVNVSGQFATISAAYSIPILINAVVANYPCSSAVLVQVAGRFFGTSDSSVKVELGSSLCESSSWQASSSIRCKVSRGFGTHLKVAATVGSQIGTATFAASYDRLFLSSLSTYNAPCFLPGSMILFGNGFGFPSLNVAVAIGGSASTGSVISSDSAVLSTTAAGTGTSLSASIMIDGVLGSRLNAFSYDGTTIVFPTAHIHSLFNLFLQLRTFPVHLHSCCPLPVRQRCPFLEKTSHSCLPCGQHLSEFQAVRQYCLHQILALVAQRLQVGACCRLYLLTSMEFKGFLSQPSIFLVIF